MFKLQSVSKINLDFTLIVNDKLSSLVAEHLPRSYEILGQKSVILISNVSYSKMNLIENNHKALRTPEIFNLTFNNVMVTMLTF